MLAIPVVGNGEELVAHKETGPPFQGTAAMLHATHVSIAAPLELVKKLGPL